MNRIHFRRDRQRPRVGWLAMGWFWVVALLVLPNCSFSVTAGSSAGPNLNPGSEPRSAAIFCDIEKERHCASPTEKAMGIRLAAAALGLNTGQTGIGLDDSPDALARCAGEPEAVIYQGAFPKGYSVCVNCGEVIPATYLDANQVCVAQCEDFFGTIQADGTLLPDNPPSDANRQYCESHAKVSTNAPPNGCFADACTSGGTAIPDFADPRRIPEPVIWIDLIGTVANGNNLTKTTPTVPVTPNAGGASAQRFARGDGYVEFSANETNLTHALGLSPDPAGCTPPCHDTDGTANDLGFFIVLNIDGRVYLGENGAQIIGPGPNGSFRNSYAVGERYRVNLRDNSDGTAKISYSRLIGPCVPGSPCGEEVLFTSIAPAPRYPFRVDTSFREQNATVTDVRIVRIQ